MFGIPTWAIGVVASCAGLGIMVVLMRLGEGLKRSVFGGKREGRGPHTVIGMHVGTRGASTPNPEVLEELHRRVAELEERLDFAERLLVKRPHHENLIPRR